MIINILLHCVALTVVIFKCGWSQDPNNGHAPQTIGLANTSHWCCLHIISPFNPSLEFIWSPHKRSNWVLFSLRLHAVIFFLCGNLSKSEPIMRAIFVAGLNWEHWSIESHNKSPFIILTCSGWSDYRTSWFHVCIGTGWKTFGVIVGRFHRRDSFTWLSDSTHIFCI